MRKIFLPVIILLVAVTGFTACSKIAAAIFGGTDINVPTTEFTIPIILAVSPNEQSFGSASQHMNIDSAVKANTAGVFGINVVNAIKIKQVKMELVNGDAVNNFSNFETVRVTLGADTQPGTVDIFTASFPDTNSSTYIFEPTNSPDLLPFLRGSWITYRIYGKNRRITSKPLTLQVTVTLRAD